MKYNENTKIAIIGAGASGLTAGWELTKKGYKNITIFERENQVGGKTFTHQYKDKNLELGSMMFSRFDRTAKMAREFNVPFESFETKGFYCSEGKFVSPFAYAQKTHSLPSILKALFKIKRIIIKNRLSGIGYYENIDPELFQNFSAYCKLKNLEPAATIFEPAVSGLGYGYFEETPAVYALKIISSFLNFSLLVSLLFNGNTTCYFPGGWTALWKKVASKLNVKCDARISEISRENNQIKIIEDDKTYFFDKLIVTTPLNKLETFLDIQQEEKELFKKIQYNRMISTLVEFSEPVQRSSFFADNTRSSRAGHVLGVENYYPETNFGVLFQTAPFGTSQDEINSMIQQDILKELGCEVNKIILQKEWDYFYYVKTQDLQGGFYKKIYSMQGEKNTFYLGSIFNYETVAHCEEYAINLVNKSF